MIKKQAIPIPVYDVVPEGDVYRVQRNGRMLSTPEGKPYDLSTQKLAQAIAEEWQAQGDKIDTNSMPLTQLAATALDIVVVSRAKIIKSMLAYTQSELLCHRAQRPESLVARQDKEWQPLLDWCHERFSVRLCTTCGVMPVAQEDKTQDVLREALESYDDFWLTGLQQAADVAGSLVLGLALTESHRTAAQVFDISELDVVQQNKTWGEDPVIEGRQKAVRFDLEAVEKWFAFLK